MPDRTVSGLERTLVARYRVALLAHFAPDYGAAAIAGFDFLRQAVLPVSSGRLNGRAVEMRLSDGETRSDAPSW